MNYDINLMPKSSKKATRVLFVTLLLSFIVIGGLGYWGYYLPTQERNGLKEDMTQMEEELRVLEDMEVAFIQLTEQINDIRNIELTFQTLKKNENRMTGIFSDLEYNIPKNLVIDKINIHDGLIMIGGISPTHKEIAQYIVNLRKLNYVYDVKFINTKNNENGEERYDFTIQVSLIWHGQVTNAEGDK